MGMPAARLTDMHQCPLHVGGPIFEPGCPTVLIAGLPAARLNDLALCQGNPIDAIADASHSVLIGGLPAARLGDPTRHGGRIVAGAGTVLIGD